ncbi:MAG: coproporphyrinogen dehydrogenase HemZ [Lachnospiraceae bacterium]
MIQIRLKSEYYSYDVFHIVKAFFPIDKIERQVDESLEPMVQIEWSANEKICILEEDIKQGMDQIKIEYLEQYETAAAKKKHIVNMLLYHFLEETTKKSLDWGILTGIRPTKIAMKELERGKTKEEVIAWMQEHYLVSGEKAVLGVEIALWEIELLKKLDYQNGYSLYVGIPFCPTTCSYCSFTSFPLHLWKNRVDEYLDALCKEITFVGQVSKQKKLNSIYIGGGTPTTLEEEQLDRLLCHIEDTFSFDALQEITVEAGRPDSITKGKLEVLRRHSISRISINPQTMNQKTLDKIGRKHTVEDIIVVYQMARDLGFDNINMDLIMGLPGESLEETAHTLKEIKKLQPDSLTIHSLAMKRASRLGQMQREEVDIEKEAHQMSEMIHLAAAYAKDMELKPYYLYRQKNIAGNFENVGYAKVDKAGIYNILIMEEKQSIVAVGAGASTKIVLPRKKDYIVRIENVKDIDLYIARMDEMIERKGEWLWR